MFCGQELTMPGRKHSSDITQPERFLMTGSPAVWGDPVGWSSLAIRRTSVLWSNWVWEACALQSYRVPCCTGRMVCEFPSLARGPTSIAMRREN